MVLFYGSFPFSSLLDYDIQTSTHPMLMNFSSHALGPFVILSDEYFYFDFFDKFKSSISAYLINILDKDNHAYLLIFKQLEDGCHIHIVKSVEININEEPTNPNIFYLGDVLHKVEQVKAITLVKKYIKIFAFDYQDMPGMDHNIIIYNIVTHPDIKPIKQKPW